MKKAFGLMFAVSLLVVAMATAALAAVPGDGTRDLAGVGSEMGNGYAWGFGDGISDNFVDIDGDDVCASARIGGGQSQMRANGPGHTR